MVSLIKVFLQLLLFCVEPFALPITNHNSGDVKTYDSVILQKRSYRPSWVFWYYSGNGGRDCGNYCLIAFLVGSLVILLMIICGCYRCYQVKKYYATGKFSWERRMHNNTENLSENEGDEETHDVTRERRESRQETELPVPLTPPPPYSTEDTKQ
ncbi:3079_t:CDS:1 [Cetraspora pellucida]|uniref:3079_t:CDS:1 n=1 Tax=Cetraspora pellucida TaxID=1433469 RepID=A0ACA9NKL3_9GLOM|nr:3079_t:CDS:1 [Cetraspora pellucida]